MIRSTPAPLERKALYVQVLVSWTDPHGYNREVALLQSTPGAVQIMVKHRRAAHGHVRQHFKDVSPLVAAALSAKVASAGARRIIRP